MKAKSAKICTNKKRLLEYEKEHENTNANLKLLYQKIQKLKNVIHNEFAQILFDHIGVPICAR